MKHVFPICHWSGARAAKFDGVDDHLTRGGDLTGNADGKLGLVSFWFKLNGNDGVRMSAYATDRGIFGANEITRVAANNLWFLRMASAGGGAVEQFRSATVYIADNTWHHFAASWDLNIVGAQHLFIDAIDDLADDIFKIHNVGQTIIYKTDDHSIAAEVEPPSNPAVDFLDACLAEVYLNFAEFLDLSVAANLEKFRTSGGAPENLGSDGSTPTGNIPIVYLSGGVPEFFTNKGSGGDFTKQGAPVSCETAPP